MNFIQRIHQINYHLSQMREKEGIVKTDKSQKKEKSFLQKPDFARMNNAFFIPFFFAPCVCVREHLNKK